LRWEAFYAKQRPVRWEAVALAVAQERRSDAVPERVVGLIAAQDDMALVRVWLIAPGDLCPSCPMGPECGDRDRCLHLASSAGTPADPSESWNRLGGAFRRVPLGRGKVGRVGATGSSLLLHDMSERSTWIVRPGWAAREGIRGFAAHPLVFRGDVLGVLGVFSRARIDVETFAWLRTVADHAAVALASARAFEDLARRHARLEAENGALRIGERPDPPAPLPAAEWRRLERANLEAALARAGGRIYGRGGAAEILGLPPTTLASRVKALGITRRASR
jgi:transcriptional regulator with GAF, ATPase, and Fis domain